METLLILSFVAESYDAWRKVYDSRAAIRAEAGLSTLGVYHSLADPDNITVIFKSASAEAAKKFIDSQSFRDALLRAGVMKSPDIKIIEKM